MTMPLDLTFLLTTTPRTFSVIALSSELLIVHGPSGKLLGTSTSASTSLEILEQLHAAGWTQQPITEFQHRLIQTATDRVQAVQPSTDPRHTPARLLEAVLSRVNLLLPAFAQPLTARIDAWLPARPPARSCNGQVTRLRHRPPPRFGAGAAALTFRS